MTETPTPQQEADRLYGLWRAAVDASIATGDRAKCREALRLFEAYRLAKERAATAGLDAVAP